MCYTEKHKSCFCFSLRKNINLLQLHRGEVECFHRTVAAGCPWNHSYIGVFQLSDLLVYLTKQKRRNANNIDNQARIKVRNQTGKGGIPKNWSCSYGLCVVSLRNVSSLNQVSSSICWLQVINSAFAYWLKLTPLVTIGLWGQYCTV